MYLRSARKNRTRQTKEKLALVMVSMLALVFMLVDFSVACPPWTVYNTTSGECQCGDHLSGVVKCDSDSKKILLLQCYCMSYNRDFNTTVVGPCNAMCRREGAVFYGPYRVLNIRDVTQLNSEFELCGEYNREGQLCGRCKNSTGLPVYSYSLKCVPCLETEFKSNLFKYVAVAFLPLTIFYLGAVMIKLSVTSGNMVAYVLVCQIVSVPATQRHIVENIKKIHISDQLMGDLYSVWNLDFFRSLLQNWPFCIHPKMSTLHILALDYLVGVYPLFLIFLTYIAVILHDRYPLVVKIWRPVYRVFMCIRQEWDICGSLVQSFATFLVLSYVKILYVSIDLLTPVYLKTVDGGTLNQTYLFYAGDLVYFGSEHLPFGILAVFMLTVFNILPMVLLFLYPCGWFRKCLSCCGANNHVLHTFMEAFQGCYRHQPRDCRYFTAMYLLLRILSNLSSVFFTSRPNFALNSFLFTFVILSLVLLTPYRKDVHNKLDTFFFLGLLSAFSLDYLQSFIWSYSDYCQDVFRLFLCLVGLTPVLYGITLFLCKVLPRKFQVNLKRYSNMLITCRRRSLEQDVEDQEYPHRFETENTLLLP